MKNRSIIDQSKIALSRACCSLDGWVSGQRAIFSMTFNGDQADMWSSRRLPFPWTNKAAHIPSRRRHLAPTFRHVLTPIPWNMVVPPESTTLALKLRKQGKDASNERIPTSVSSCSLPLCRWRQTFVPPWYGVPSKWLELGRHFTGVNLTPVRHAVYHAKTRSSVSQKIENEKIHPWNGGKRRTSPCGCQGHTSWNPQGRHLLNGNAWHNSDDVSVWELTGPLLACRSKLCDVVYTNKAQFQCPLDLSTKLVAAVAAQQHFVDRDFCRNPNQCSSTSQW